MDLKEKIFHKLDHNKRRAVTSLKLILLSVITGIVTGLTGALFYYCLGRVTSLRQEQPLFLLLLPVGAILIYLVYRLCGYEEDGGTNLILTAIQADDEIPLRMTPLIFVSTVFSHLCGASVGREGAALQMGGSLGATVSRIFRLEDADKKTMIMAGMSGAFSALFGTPLAASFFSMEVVSVGIMHYAALVPCVASSFIARAIASQLGAPAPFFDIGTIPDFTPAGAGWTVLLAALCGLVSIVFCFMLHRGSNFSKEHIPNPYIRGLIFGSIILLLTAIVRSQTYNGAGIDHIVACMDPDYDAFELGFLVKILFTVLSIIAGYRGGEIVPSFFIGASLGSAFGDLVGFDPALCAAMGMGAVFCGITNCPVTSLLICIELFGLEGAPYFLLACAFSYLMSGYYGLYSGQRIVYSKYRSNYINKQTK